MAKFRQEHSEPDSEWSRWVNPIMKGYKLACCDCGLVHDFEFRAFKVVKTSKNGKIVKLLPIGKYQVEFKCRRNKRSTGQMRRKRK